MDRRVELDAYSPLEISEKIETVGVVKARMATLATLTLGVRSAWCGCWAASSFLWA
jgi:hypothetical protein